MNTTPTYFLDSTALFVVRARYPADEFPEVWETLADLAKSGGARSPVQVLIELRAQADAELAAWAETNSALFHELDDEQIEVARQIKTRYRKLFKPDDGKSDSVPFVIALAATRRARNDKSTDDCVVVANGPLPARFDLIEICEDPAYDVGFMSNIRMLRELGLKVPAPRGSLMDLWGIWKDLGITEEDIEASRIVFKGSER